MKKPPQVALLCAGSLAANSIARLPGLARHLGPVKSSSLRLASRYVNALRAGFPVDDFGRFQSSDIVMIACPDSAAVEMVEAMSSAPLDWRGKCIAVCSEQLEADILSRLAIAGANTASIGTVDGMDALLIEGDRTAVAQLRRVLRTRTRPKLLVMPPGQKKFYLAATACTGPLLAALLGCAGESLKRTGLSAAEAASLIQEQAQRTTRAFLKGGKKAPSQPDLADFFERTLTLAQQLGVSKRG